MSTRDDTIDDSSTVLDGEGGRQSFEQETVVSDYGTINEYASRLDLGHLNLVSWKAGARKVYMAGSDDGPVDESATRLKFHGTSSDPGITAEAHQPFTAISDLVCHPSKTPAPLRGSRKPLPPTSAGAPPIPKPPPDGFYQPYLDNITKPGPQEEQTGIESLWTAWDQARRGVKTAVAATPSDVPGREPEKLDDLSAVDPMFFNEEFDLAKPLIWQAVLGSDTSTDPANSNHAQEDLSHQLDVLESHLVSEISRRTPQFFSALSNLQSLTAQTSSCLDRLTSLRTQLAQLDQSTAIRGLQIADRQEDLHVARMTERALTQVEGVASTLEIVRQVADEGDWIAGQEGLEDVGRWWLKASPERRVFESNKATTSNGGGEVKDGKHVLSQLKEEDEEEVVDGVPLTDTSTTPLNPAPFIPLATLPALQYIPDEMSSIAATIQDQLELSFASICAAILDTTPPIELVDDAPEKRQSEVTKKPRQWRIRTDEEERLRSSFTAQIGGLFHAFWRTDPPPQTTATTNAEKERPASPRPHTSSVTRIENVWRLAVMKCIKEGMRQLLQLGSDADGEPSENGGDATATGIAKGCVAHFLDFCLVLTSWLLRQSLVDTLKDMSHDRFVSISEQMYETMVARIELVRVLGEVLETQLRKTKWVMVDCAWTGVYIDATFSRPSEPTILAQVMGGDPASTTSLNGSTNFIESILHSAVDLANARASKILLTRTEIHAELDLGRFVSVYNSSWQFILWSEALVGRVVGSLRGVVVAQVCIVCM